MCQEKFKGEVLKTSATVAYLCRAMWYRQGYCRSGFTTLSPMLLREQPAVVLLLERALGR
jgi:hypothetical protein